MIELLKQQLTENMTAEDKVSRVREFLQALTLKIIYDKGYFRSLAFVGGTALRFLFGLRRFSEDLDFSLIDKKGYDFAKAILSIERELRLYGLHAEARTRDDKTVQSSFLKFGKLLKELGISDMSDQKLSIKIEVDSNPPAGWRAETTVVNKRYLINLTHFDISSLYATKLHACFFRHYTKGRDFYDLVWYIARRASANCVLLNNAIRQTEGRDLGLNESNVNEFILANLEKVDFKAARKDVERFLEDKSELKLLDLQTIKSSLVI